MRKKLTAASVEKLQAPASGRLEIWDTVQPGLHLRIGVRDRRVWCVKYRLNGRQVRQTIGPVDRYTLAEARDRARDIQRAADRGDDPRPVRATPGARPRTVEQVAEAYIRRDVRVNLKSARWVEGIVRSKLIAAWGPRLIERVEQRDVVELLEQIADRGKLTMANRTLAIARRLFNWAIGKGYLRENPAAAVEPPLKHEPTRDRILAGHEIAALWRACDAEGWPFGPFVKLLLLTGQRESEVARMRYQDRDGARWIIPDPKNRQPHEVPLPPVALALLEAAPRFIGEYAITTTGGKRPISGFSKAKARIDQRLATLAEQGEAPPVGPWRFHDLRRTCASGMAEIGIAPHVVEKVLNHRSGTIRGVAAVYNRFDYQAEKTAALAAWAAHVEALVAPVAREARASA